MSPAVRPAVPAGLLPFLDGPLVPGLAGRFGDLRREGARVVGLYLELGGTRARHGRAGHGPIAELAGRADRADHQSRAGRSRHGARRLRRSRRRAAHDTLIIPWKHEVEFSSH